MKLEILLSTMNCKDTKDLQLEKRNMIDEDLIIINQTNNFDVKNNYKKQLFNCNEFGLSKSRNKAINKSSADICLIADDDIIYKKEAFNNIIKAFEENPEADIITFQIETPDGGLFKKYPDSEFWHNKRTILKVSSIDIALRRESIIKKNIQFDELFGLGSVYNTGEQNIFLKDCLDRGLKIKYIPIPIVVHPYENSGREYNYNQFLSKGAVFYRLFGLKGVLLNIIFALKKRNEYKDKINIFKAIYLMNKGTLDYISYTRRKRYE